MLQHLHCFHIFLDPPFKIGTKRYFKSVIGLVQCLYALGSALAMLGTLQPLALGI